MSDGFEGCKHGVVEGVCKECLAAVIEKGQARPMPETSTPSVTLQGWICSRCGQSNSPYVSICSGCRTRPSTHPYADCSCPPYGTCNNTACPRRIRVTCSTEGYQGPPPCNACGQLGCFDYECRQ